ncbi:cyanate transporter [Paraburkholderia bonniea]|uniref:cyanate transporter n=1 Tax=Paraburkholderia bonniea TaxID=2152891 RepID=UPI0012925D3D|nr:cyanate transporter [Paraburkholderia bonniea]WJF92129.1 cyanate transporter [Paraburkholderia bonniea]WJF95449.1 cyanate transporter [Paraburkholderia bonniea]
MNSSSHATPHTLSPTVVQPAALTWRDGVWLAVVVAIGINLRPLLTSISPLLESIRHTTGLSFYGASLLTSLPVIAMGIGAFGASTLARLLGETRGVALGLIAIAFACAARWITSSGFALMFSAVIAGIGVAAIQALLPGVMKRHFGVRVTLAMGVFSASIMGGGGLGASLSPWVAHLAGTWHAGLAFWALPALLGMALWLVLNRALPLPVPSNHTQSAQSTAQLPSMWRNRRAWALGLYFGVVNGGYTSLVAWLPAYYQQHGMSVTASGSLLAMMTLFQAAAALLLPLAAQSSHDRRPWLLVGLLAQLAGIAGLLAWPLAAPLPWVALAGIGLGGSFSLTLVTALDHTENHAVAARLVAFMQGVGFLIAAIAPIVAGMVRDATGSFSAAWVMLVIGVLAMIALTFVFSPRSYARVWSGS